MSTEQMPAEEQSTNGNNKATTSNKKHWKGYLLEFILIFLAVTLSFFAESYREHLKDKADEKIYIRSIIADLEKDQTDIQIAIKDNLRQFDGLKELADLLRKSQWTNDESLQLYELNTNYALTISTAAINNMTMRQLLSSGDMRLIEEPQVADTIMQYYGLAKDNYDRQQNIYGEIMGKLLFSSSDIFSFKYTQFDMQQDSTFSFGFSKEAAEFKLNTTNKVILEKYSELILAARALNAFYINHQHTMKQRAASLATFLRKQYELN